jgi:nitrogen regulatory protein P-II 1
VVLGEPGFDLGERGRRERFGARRGESVYCRVELLQSNFRHCQAEFLIDKGRLASSCLVMYETNFGCVTPKCASTCGVMKKIEAIIKPFKMEQVREALIEIGVEGVTVSEVKMSGRHADHTSISRGGEYFSDFLPKLKFEIVVADSRVRRTVQAIVGKARTGRINDGRVFVVPIQEAIRIRTGQRGESAV